MRVAVLWAVVLLWRVEARISLTIGISRFVVAKARFSLTLLLLIGISLLVLASTLRTTPACLVVIALFWSLLLFVSASLLCNVWAVVGLAASTVWAVLTMGARLVPLVLLAVV
jgi:hypothetical protein